MELTIRKANINDSPFIAWTVATALGIPKPEPAFLAEVETIGKREDTLYSWKNSLIAQVDNCSVGCLVCYEGARYQTMREITFPLILQMSGNDFSAMESETCAGEYYLDSMAVLPEYRNKGIATLLLKHGIETAKNLNIPRVCMVVSPQNPKVQQLYEPLGFQYERNMFLFNEPYKKMVKKISINEPIIK